MDRQQYEKAYRYVRCEKYKSAVDASLDYDFYSPCSGCSAECPRFESCMDAADYQNLVACQIQELVEAEMKRLESGLQWSEIEIVRKHYYSKKQKPEYSIVQNIANRFGLAHVRSYSRDFTPMGWEWRGYRWAKQEIAQGKLVEYYAWNLAGFFQEARSRFTR